MASDPVSRREAMRGRTAVGGLRTDNVRRNGDAEQTSSSDRVRAAAGYAGPPRWAHPPDGAAAFAAWLPTFGPAGFLVAPYVLLHSQVLSWLPSHDPATTLAAVCLVMSLAVRGHDPRDARYAALRWVLQAVVGVALAARLVTDLANGWDRNGWWAVHKLPDAVRLWGDLDGTLRVLLADPVGAVLLLAFLSDLFVPERARSALTGGGFWAGYLAPPPVEHPETAGRAGLGWLPFLFVAPTLTGADAAYALALGLGVSFVVGYVAATEAADLLSVRRQRPAERAAWFATYSDRRYLALHALCPGLPLLAVPFLAGAAGLLAAPAAPYGPLLPLALALGGCAVACPRHTAVVWQAVFAFATYPGDRHPRPGVHDLAPVARDPEVRAGLLRVAVLAWVPFTHWCVRGLLPALPAFDGWGVVWTDLSVGHTLAAAVILVLGPPQLVCGVIRAAYGRVLGRFEDGGVK